MLRWKTSSNFLHHLKRVKTVRSESPRVLLTDPCCWKCHQICWAPISLRGTGMWLQYTMLCGQILSVTLRSSFDIAPGFQAEDVRVGVRIRWISLKRRQIQQNRQTAFSLLWENVPWVSSRSRFSLKHSSDVDTPCPKSVQPPSKHRSSELLKCLFSIFCCRQKLIF